MPDGKHVIISVLKCCLCQQVVRPEFVEYMCGNRLLPGSEPAAHCYCGHQFGHFSGQLGDGCAQSVTYSTTAVTILAGPFPSAGIVSRTLGSL